MAIFHLSVKTVSRSAGRSATAASAYRAGVQITDERTGEIHDYRRRGGVESAHLFLPADAPEWASDRNELWNAAEKSETRKNSTVAREFEVALPAELNRGERQALAHEFTQALVEKYGFAADCAIHFPHKKENQSKRKDAAVENGDSRNHHAHILCTTRKLTAEGFTVKTRELDDRKTGADQVVECRALLADMTNAALAKAGHSARVDHRSLAAQGIDDRDAGIHLGPIATAIERRGEVSEKTQNHQARQAEAAGKVAALVAIAQAQVQAAEQALAAAKAQAQAQAQAEHAALAAAAKARELAISAQLTAFREIENDRVRDEAFASIHRHVAAAGRSSAATGRALVFAVADHAGIAENLGAAGGDLGRAVKGAERRVAERHYGRVVEAVRGQFERAGGVVQQVADRIERVVRSVTAATQAVARQAAVRVELARQRAADKPVDIDPRSRYHPDNIARQAAQDAALTKSAPLTTAQRLKLARAEMPRMGVTKAAAEIERKPAATPAAPPPLTPQEDNALLVRAASAKKAQWEALLKEERALYLKELTQQAYDKAVAHVAEHEAHIDAKPMLFGRDKWEAQRQGFESRDTANNREWKTLKEGGYPFLERDKEAVQQAVERRVSAKNPVLAREMPKVNEILLVERERVDALERDRQAQERAEKAKTQELDEVLSAFKRHALKRETKSLGYGDTGPQWCAIPEPLRKAIEDFNRLPQEARPAVLERMRENMQRDPQGVETFRQGLQPSRGNDRGMSR